MPFKIKYPFRRDYTQNPSKPCYGVCIPLTLGFHALIDADDYPIISQANWYAKHCGTLENYNGLYVYSTKERIPMHRHIMGNPDSFIDHVNGNGLDNRKENLRQCTALENSRNRKINKGKTYKGVYLHKPTGKFYARIKVDEKLKHLSTHDNEIDAALAYDMAAIKHFGQFSRLNFPQNEGATQ